MSQNRPVDPTKTITGVGRLCYPHVWEPYAINGDKLKYSCCPVIPKSDTVTVAKLRKSIEAAYKKDEAKLKGKDKAVPPLSAIRSPLRDGDLERPDDPAFAGMWFLNAKSDYAPDIVDRDNQKIVDQSEVYPGCWCRFALSFYAYNFNGNRGIGCSLNNIQKVRDGERLGGRSRAQDDFDVFTEDDGAIEDFLA